MGLFNNNIQQQNPNSRAALEAKYNSSRLNILWVVVFTAINVIMLSAGSDRSFLFSAAVPTYLITFSMIYCGMYPEEYYADFNAFDFVDKSLYWGALVVSILIIGFYLLCFFMAKKKVGWLISALIFFALDTALMLLVFGFSSTMIMDYVFHAWVIVILSTGISAYNKLKALPKEEAVPASYEVEAENVADSENGNNGEQY